MIPTYITNRILQASIAQNDVLAAMRYAVETLTRMAGITDIDDLELELDNYETAIVSLESSVKEMSELNTKIGAYIDAIREKE